MIEISQIRFPCGTDPGPQMEHRIRSLLRLKEGEAFTYRISRHAVDARKKPELYDVYSVRVTLTESGADDERRILSRIHDRNVRPCRPAAYEFPRVQTKASALSERPVVIGFGPAGMFCALMLARAGFCPIVFERGQRVEERAASVSTFWESGILNPQSNIQFGEGGAGTFSDGKLNSNIKDSTGRITKVLETFVEAGAPEDILYEQIPHIGTDRLRIVVRRLREEILSLGGDIRFDTLVSGLVLREGRVRGVRYRSVVPPAPEGCRAANIASEGCGAAGTKATPAAADEDGLRCAAGMECGPEPGPAEAGGQDFSSAAENRSACAATAKNRPHHAMAQLSSRGDEQYLPCSVVVLAPGHSARDTIRMLHALGVPMETKSFAVGFRVSHPQALINRSQYGVCGDDEMRRLHLAPANYRLTAKGGGGRGVYSFCMCPGGYVVNASSEPHRLAVNGMSDYLRDSTRANSAIVMSVSPGDYGTGVLDGMKWQEQLEERAYAIGAGAIPVQRFPSFEKGETDAELPPDTELCIRGRISPGALHTLLPADLTADFITGMHAFGRKIRDFDGKEAYVIGLESRTSSPVRILRDASGESEIRGLYPCGEGAGYAGGITSAAVDGIRTAEQVARRLRAEE